MTEVRTMRLTDWLIDTDPANDGAARGWTAAVSGTAKKTAVPSIIQQTFPGYHGAAFYWNAFIPALSAGERDRLLLRFDGVDYKAAVWLNGVLLGENEGGEVPFSFDVTDTVRRGAENLLAVRVVNPAGEDIDGLNITNVPNRNKTIEKRAGSSLNHGGIWYGVALESLPAACVDAYFFSGDAETGRLTARAALWNAAEETAAALSLFVYEGDRLAAYSKTSVVLRPGKTETEIRIDVPGFRLWDVDDPCLYRAELRLETENGRHSVSARVGFRDLRVKDGWFYLNGRKLFIKSAHTGNAFPAGQMFPAVPAMTRQDLYYAKAAGFNMLRAIAGTFRPEQLDFCDEIGLMVYEECFAAWCLGEGGCPVGDKEAMLRRWDRCTEAMIRRDRNHPSVVIWGLLNETREGPVFRRAVGFLPRARELDPTRLILLNAGRFDNAPALGSVSNPGSRRWECVWGNEGGKERLSPLLDMGLNDCAGDFHTYPEVPMNETVLSALRTLGEGSRPVFLSEFGTGAAFDVTDEWRHFQQSGLRTDLEDAAWVKDQSDSLRRDWRRFGLEAAYPAPELMLRESQRLNADARYRDFNTVRSNPNLCGFSLTGLLDHGMCGEGLWTYWRRWKPEMFDAVSDGWSPLRFCLFVKPHFYAGEPAVFEAVLANDGVLAPGVYTAQLAIVGDNGTVAAFDRTFTVEKDVFAVPVCKETLTPDLAAGAYTFTAFLSDGGAPAGNALRFYVADPADSVPAARSVHVCGVADETRRWLASRGVAAVDCVPENGVLLAGEEMDESAFMRVLAAAKNGATAIFLNAGLFLRQPEWLALTGAPDDIRMANRRDWLYHKECVMKPDPVFGAFGAGLVDFPRFGQTFPHPAIETEKTPDLILCPAFYTGFHEFRDAYGAAHVLCGFACGAGMLIFNCFAIEGNLFTEPAAGLLLKGLLDRFGV